MGKMTKPLYYSYWGKADNPLKVAYCSGNDRETIFSCFKKQIASRLRKTESALQLEDLDVLAKKEKWQYKQPNYASYHLLPFHCLDVAAVQTTNQGVCGRARSIIPAGESPALAR